MHGQLLTILSNHNVAKKKMQSMSENIILHFKNESEVVNPTIYISRNYEVEKCNYIWVEDLRRYYYITSCTLEQQRYVLQCHVDVLTSFYKDILKQRAIIERNAKEFNLYLDDDKLKTFKMTRTETFPWDISFLNGDNEKESCFVLAICGGGNDTENSVDNETEGGV
jgi:hypothetical protein